jgi:hypothetical protein
MGWFERAKKASAGERVTRADREHAMDAVAELTALRTERERLLQDGVTGTATIVGIRENVARSALGDWHELTLEVRLPDRNPYRATSRVALELSTVPQISVGAEVPVRVDPNDRSKVLVVAQL